MRVWLAGLIVVLAFAAGATPADAANCTIATSPVVFGAYNVFTVAPLDSTGTVTYECNGGARNVTIAISRGQGSFASRKMNKGAESLLYNLYLDAARTVVWGDGNGVSELYADRNPPNKQEVAVPVYGRIPAEQDISVGPYADSLVVEMNF